MANTTPNRVPFLYPAFPTRMFTAGLAAHIEIAFGATNVQHVSHPTSGLPTGNITCEVGKLHVGRLNAWLDGYISGCHACGK